VSRTLEEIAKGEGDLTKTISVSGKDEIGSLAHYFNLTLEKIRTMVITIKEQSSSLHDIGGRLASNMAETAAAINEIATTIQHIKERVIRQNANISETNTTMEQITVSINQLNAHVENQQSNVSQSSAAIEQLLANIESVTHTLVKNTGNVNEEPRSKSWVSSLDRKFIILAGYIPRSENRSTTFLNVVNFSEQAPGYVPRPPIKVPRRLSHKKV
jgi:methyl-accepting chemotaxis protein